MGLLLGLGGLILLGLLIHSFVVIAYALSPKRKVDERLSQISRR